MRRSRRVLLILVVLLLLVAAACGCHFWRSLHAREQEQQLFETLEEEVALPEPSLSPTTNSDEENQQDVVLHDSAALTSTNSDYVGWLSIPGTVINYPVMFSPSEPERYLHLDYYKQYSYSGTPFLDARCDPNEGNLIIYGHNMINGTMFGSLKSYRNENYLNSHKTIFLELSDGVHMFEIMSAVTLEKDDPWNRASTDTFHMHWKPPHRANDRRSKRNLRRHCFGRIRNCTHSSRASDVVLRVVLLSGVRPRR